MSVRRHPLWRFLPLALVVAGAAGGLGAWIEHRRAPPRPADQSTVGTPLGSPGLSEGSRRPLDEETAKALIVGLGALTRMRMLETPARNEAMGVLTNLQLAREEQLINSEGSAVALPLCPPGPLQPGGQPWPQSCTQAWAPFGWTPDPRGTGSKEPPPRLLCRYMVQPDAQGSMQAFAICDEFNDGELELYQVLAQGPIEEVDEPELSPFWLDLNPDSLASDAD
ncbi:MAG: hypothetical protein ACI9VR_001163 [Cognaticolwellia sp.]